MAHGDAGSDGNPFGYHQDNRGEMRLSWVSIYINQSIVPSTLFDDEDNDSITPSINSTQLDTREEDQWLA